MRKIGKGALLAGVLGIALSTAARAEERGDPPLAPYLIIEGREASPASLEDVMAQSGVKTLSYLTIKDGTIGEVTTIGGGFADSGVVPLFQSASISKSVASLGILRLAEQHGLDIDADVNAYLTGWKVDYTGYEDAPKVTIRRLLSHRAGLTVHGFPGYAPGDAIPDTAGVLEGAGNTGAVTLFQAPGTGFSYSGGGYTVLQLLVEDVTGLSFADYMEREVLEPLGMKASHFRDEPGAPHATAKAGDGTEHAAAYHIYPEKAAAALWTTAPDLARFLIAVDAIVEGERADILSPALASQWLVVPKGEGPENYALGFGVDRAEGHDVFQHSGSNHGYKSLMFYDRKSDDGFVALADADRGYIVNSMLARGFALSRGIGFMGQRTLVPVDQSASAWESITGDWEFPDGPLAGRRFRFSSTSPSDMLAVEIATGEESRLLAIGAMEFIDTDTQSALVFKPNEDGVMEAEFAGRFRMVRVD